MKAQGSHKLSVFGLAMLNVAAVLSLRGLPYSSDGTVQLLI